MFCENCGREVAEGAPCNFCGFDSRYDRGDKRLGKQKNTHKTPAPTRIVVHKKKNGAAIAGMIFSFLGANPMFGFIGFILNLVGLKKIKYCHRGKMPVIFGFGALALWILIYIVVLKALGLF